MLNELESIHPYLPDAVGGFLLALAAIIAHYVTKALLKYGVNKFAAKTRSTWDDALVNANVFGTLAQVVPAVVVQRGAPLIPHWTETFQTIVNNLTLAWIALTLARALAATLSAANVIYEQRPESRDRPIKGFIQLAQLGVYIVGAIMVVSALLGRSPVILLSGIGAITAVLLIVFKDTLLSLAASVQLASQQLIRVGDWLEMPEFGADGDVIEVALYTVTVQNWDKTITTIPTYSLVTRSFKNWRGMIESGGRRIKRSFHIDVNTIGYVSDEQLERFKHFNLLDDYIPAKLNEIEKYNAGIGQETDLEANMRRLTNIGTLRAYILNYLRNHPKIHKNMTLIVRQLAPDTTGLPIEVYCFSNDINWANFEDIQSDIFDHIYAIIPEFGLRLYQQPAGTDFAQLASR